MLDPFYMNKFYKAAICTAAGAYACISVAGSFGRETFPQSLDGFDKKSAIDPNSPEINAHTMENEGVAIPNIYKLVKYLKSFYLDRLNDSRYDDVYIIIQGNDNTGNELNLGVTKMGDAVNYYFYPNGKQIEIAQQDFERLLNDYKYIDLYEGRSILMINKRVSDPSIEAVIPYDVLKTLSNNSILGYLEQSTRIFSSRIYGNPAGADTESPLAKVVQRSYLNHYIMMPESAPFPKEAYTRLSPNNFSALLSNHESLRLKQVDFES